MKSILYSSPLRPIYESTSAFLWAAGAVLMAIGAPLLSVPMFVAWLFAGASGWFAVVRWKAARPLRIRQRGLGGPPIARMTFEQLREKMVKDPGSVWLGRGFPWSQLHAQLSHELITEQFPDIARRFPMCKQSTQSKGLSLLHGLGMPEEGDVRMPFSHLAGHMLILGTTGAGKTRLLDILATQCILRDEAVIVFDPKGDLDLARSLRRSCERAGQPGRFVYFSPARPDESALINPMSSFARASELASRLAALISSGGSGDVFKDFGWMAMNKVITGMLRIESSPDIVAVRRLLEMGADQLLSDFLQRHLDQVEPNWRQKVNAKNKADQELREYARIYRDLHDDQKDNDVDGLLNMVEHNREHFGKMVASLLPVLTMLTSGPLRELLSPGRAASSDPRQRTDIRTIVRERKVLYVSLDSLSDSVVGSAIGSILLSDLTAVAGEIYSQHGGSEKPVNVFVDEAAEVINDPTIQLLNKGRGAGFRMTLLTQTLADLEVRMGSQAKARMAIGNMLNQVILRTLDGPSQQYLAENMPETVLYSIERTQTSSSGSGDPTAFSGSFAERTRQDVVPLIGPNIMGLLPDLHLFAKIGGTGFYKIRIPLLG